MASRIHGDVYVRFRGRYAETCRRKAVRRCIPSLQTNLREARPELWEQLEVENGKGSKTANISVSRPSIR